MTKKQIKKEIDKIREKLSNTKLDFTMIHTLKGNKEFLEITFQDTKKELLNG